MSGLAGASSKGERGGGGGYSGSERMESCDMRDKEIERKVTIFQVTVDEKPWLRTVNIQEQMKFGASRGREFCISEAAAHMIEGEELTDGRRPVWKRIPSLGGSEVSAAVRLISSMAEAEMSRIVKKEQRLRRLSHEM
jgi:hypothetical protein